MISKISEGVKISVEVFYQDGYSKPMNHEFIFAYSISIENHNRFAVKLLRRQWYILDGTLDIREVEGEGVVGVQPTIEVGGSFEYNSACNLQSEMGKMSGYYTFLNLNTNKTFRVNVPSFEMFAPSKMN